MEEVGIEALALLLKSKNHEGAGVALSALSTLYWTPIAGREAARQIDNEV